MTLWRRLGPRLLATAIVLAVLGTVGVNLVVTPVVLQMAAARVGQLMVIGGESELGRQCEAAPEQFYIESEGFQIWALDHTLTARNPKTPPVLPRLLDELRSGADHASALPSLFEPWGGMLLQRLGHDGPCAVFVARWARSPVVTRTALLRAGVALGVTSLVVLVLALVFVVRPLARRIHGLKAAAAGVGGDGHYQPLAQDPFDELDEVRQVLDQAHARIQRDAQILEQKNHALVTHLSDVAHDLRTPIAALQLTLEHLGNPELTDAEREDGRAAALADALYLEALCENLRFAATLREGLALEEAHCELGRVVVRVRDRLAVLARRRGVSLEVAVPDDEIVAPVARVVFERVISNLVANAVMHRKEDRGHVAVVLERGEGGDPQRFVVRVIDDGPGLPPGVQERLSSSSATTPAWDKDGHTGLGLRIVTALCARSGISVRWLSPPQGGLEVVLEGKAVTVPQQQGATVAP